MPAKLKLIANTDSGQREPICGSRRANQESGIRLQMHVGKQSHRLSALVLSSVRQHARLAARLDQSMDTIQIMGSRWKLNGYAACVTSNIIGELPIAHSQRVKYHASQNGTDGQLITSAPITMIEAPMDNMNAPATWRTSMNSAKSTWSGRGSSAVNRRLHALFDLADAVRGDTTIIRLCLKRAYAIDEYLAQRYSRTRAA